MHAKREQCHSEENASEGGGPQRMCVSARGCSQRARNVRPSADSDKSLPKGRLQIAIGSCAAVKVSRTMPTESSGKRQKRPRLCGRPSCGLRDLTPTASSSVCLRLLRPCSCCPHSQSEGPPTQPPGEVLPLPEKAYRAPQRTYQPWLQRGSTAVRCEDTGL